MKYMKKVSPFAMCIFLFSMNFTLQAQGTGEETFKTICAGCHTIKAGRLVGPDLSGIYQIRNDEWLIKFVRSSQQLIKSGDTAAIAIYEKFNKIPMPDNRLTDEQILSIINYIKVTDQSLQASIQTGLPGDSLSADSLAIIFGSEHVPGGRALFYGYTKFANGASPCISCHNIRDQSIMGGGKLALDLTGAYIKLGPAGITAIIKNSPFPAMKIALINHDLGEGEIQAVISLLKSAGEQKYYSGKPGLIFTGLGLACALILLIHIYVLYDRRRIP
jgi:cytochrome c551/c552